MEELKLFNKLDKNTRIRILTPTRESYPEIVTPFLPKDNSIRIYIDDAVVFSSNAVIIETDYFSFSSSFHKKTLPPMAMYTYPKIANGVLLGEFLYEPDAFKAFIEPDRYNNINLEDILIGKFFSYGNKELITKSMTTKLRIDIETVTAERIKEFNFHLSNNIEESLTIFFKDIFVPALTKVTIDTFKSLTNKLKEEDKLKKQQQEKLRYINPLITTIEEFVKNNNKNDELVVKNIPIVSDNLQEIEIHGSRPFIRIRQRLIKFTVLTTNELSLTKGKSVITITNEKQLLEELEKINKFYPRIGITERYNTNNFSKR